MASATHWDLRVVAGKVFESGDKNEKMLANLVAENRVQTVVSNICCADDTVTSDPAIILCKFTNFVVLVGSGSIGSRHTGVTVP